MAEDFYLRISLPTISQEQRERREGVNLADEVSSAIKVLKLNKRPGPKGFSALYYRLFSETLFPILVNAFNFLLKGQAFRQETLTVIICMLPKPHADDTTWTNYCTIALLNMGIKG